MDLTNLFSKFSGLTVMALVGESGTGKSFKSKLLECRPDYAKGFTERG